MQLAAYHLWYCRIYAPDIKCPLYLNFDARQYSLFTTRTPVTLHRAFMYIDWKIYAWNNKLHIHSSRKPHDTSRDIELHVNKRVCHTKITIMKVEVAVF